MVFINEMSLDVVYEPYSRAGLMPRSVGHHETDSIFIPVEFKCKICFVLVFFVLLVLFFFHFLFYCFLKVIWIDR